MKISNFRYFLSPSPRLLYCQKCPSPMETMGTTPSVQLPLKYSTHTLSSSCPQCSDNVDRERHSKGPANNTTPSKHKKSNRDLLRKPLKMA